MIGKTARWVTACDLAGLGGLQSGGVRETGARMLRAYGPGCDGSTIDARVQLIPQGASWIDLEEPTREEEQLVERCLKVGVPTRDELKEIEPSSRFYEQNGAIYITISTLWGVSEGDPAATPIGFVIAGNRLVTIRYASPKPFRNFMQHVRREPDLARDAPTVLARLLDAIIERLADELEAAGEEIDTISSHIFQPSAGRVPADRLSALLRRIGRTQGLLTRIRETAVSIMRAIGFLAATEMVRSNPALRERIRSLGADIAHLTDHCAFLSTNLTFLLDASLGLINVEQNAIIKIFSVAAVIFLPPTLVGTVYGMNFEHMPELEWLYGYPFAIGLMILSAVLPYWFFKRRGWL
jgi:magnesium transporter